MTPDVDFRANHNCMVENIGIFDHVTEGVEMAAAQWIGFIAAFGLAAAGDSGVFSLSRTTVFERSQHSASAFQKPNCHATYTPDLLPRETFENLRVHAVEGAMVPLAEGLPDVGNSSVSVCYFTTFADSLFSLVGTRHRPSLNAPMSRKVLAAGAIAPPSQAKYGNEFSFASSKCLEFGSANDPRFLDTQGWIISAIPALPYAKVHGRFRIGFNSRPISEDQVVFWKVVQSAKQSMDKTFTLQEGKFTVYRERAEDIHGTHNGGKWELDPIMLQGFEKGYVGFWIRVAYLAANGSSSGLTGKNLHFQTLGNDSYPDGWEHSGSVFVVPNGEVNYGRMNSTLGASFVSLQGDGATMTQMLTGGADGDEVNIRFAAANRPDRNQAPLAVYFNGEKILRDSPPTGKFQYYSLDVSLTKSDNRLTFSNNQGGSVKKCSQLTGWIRNSQNLPCAAASLLASCTHISSMTLDESRAFCTSKGARLCSAAELRAGVATGTGCDETLPSWSGDFCGDRPDRAMMVNKAGEGECVYRLGRAVARCCADDEKVVDAGVLLADVTIITKANKGDSVGTISVCDDEIKIDYAPPHHAGIYNASTAAHRSSATVDDSEEAPAAPTETSTGPPKPASTGPVAQFQFWSGSMESSQKSATLEDLGANCNQSAKFVNQFVLGSEEKVLRFSKGSGLAIPVSSLLDSGDATQFTVLFFAKFDRADCHVRLLNVNPNSDSGLYICDGLQIVPERSAGSPLTGLQWYHIGVATDKNRNVRLYLDGRMIYGWKASRSTWEGLKITSGKMVLFNDCGSECGCATNEDSGGWVSSIELFNRVLSDEEVELAFQKTRLRSRLVADFDFTTQTLESVLEVDSPCELIDNGGEKCAIHSRFMRDDSLNGNTNQNVLMVPSGGSLQLAGLKGALRSTSIYTLLLKIRFPERAICNGWLIRINEKAGVRLCGALSKFPEPASTRAATPLDPYRWYTVVLVVADGRATLYVNGMFDQTFAVDENFAIGEALHLFNGDVLDDCASSRVNATSLKVTASRIMMWDKSMSYAEVIGITSRLGSELKYTVDPESSGSPVLGWGITGTAAPANSPCSFPFIYGGRWFYDCDVSISFCRVSTTSFGYCLPGGGYMRRESRAIVGNDIGVCRGGVAACQQKCNEIDDCVGFTLSKCGSFHQKYYPFATVSNFQPYGAVGILRDGVLSIEVSGGAATAGALQKSIRVTAGVGYTLILSHKMIKGRAKVLITAPTGSVYQEGNAFLEESPSKVTFTAPGSEIHVNVTFENPLEGQALTLLEVHLVANECVDGYGEMAKGVLKGQWVGFGPSDSTDLYQKITLGPIVDIVNSTSTSLSSSITTTALIDSANSTTTVPTATDISTLCDAKLCRVDHDILGTGMVSMGVASSKTCKELAWTSNVWQLAFTPPCGYSGDCTAATNVNFATAETFCKNKGARLCTVAEVENNAVAGSGCSFDTSRIWTSSPCPCTGQKCSTCSCNCSVTTAGRDSSLGTVPRQCASRTSTANVRCCADSAPTASRDATGGCSYEVSLRYDGADITAFDEVSIPECCTLCFREPLCVGWSYARSGRRCLLKSSYIRAVRGDVEYVSGRVRDPNLNGFVFAPDINFPGYDLKDYDATPGKCVSDCSENPDCFGVHMWNGHCWLKNNLGAWSSGAGALTAWRAGGARYIRLVQVGPTVSGAAWEMTHLAFATGLALTGQPIEGQAIASGGVAGYEADKAFNPRTTRSWRCNAVADCWIGVAVLSKNPQPVAKSVYFEHMGDNFPSIVRIEESDNGINWRIVTKIRNIAKKNAVEVVGIAGGKGGDIRKVFSVPKGTGILVRNLEHAMPTGADSSYTVLVNFLIGHVDEAAAEYTRIINTAQSDNGFYVYGSQLRTVPQVASGYFDNTRWHTLSFSVHNVVTAAGKMQNIRVVLDGNVVSDALQTYNADFDVLSNIRLFNDVPMTAAGQPQCSASIEDRHVLMSRGLVYNRQLSVEEASLITRSMTGRCKHPTCNDNGQCIDGVCVCNRSPEQRGWKGEVCDVPACPGVPECNGHGECLSDGSCACERGYRGASCEKIRCPGGQYECSNHGTCVEETDSAPAFCRCDSGYRGSDCSFRMCPGDRVLSDGTYIQCNGNGVCDGATKRCTCDGFSVPSVSNYKVVEICDGSPLQLACADGVIHVISARFGRANPGACAATSDPNVGYNCHSNRTIEVVRGSCQGKDTCAINTFGGFGDPCYGTWKTLTVSYSCVTDLATMSPVAIDCSLSIPKTGLAVDLDARLRTGTGNVVTAGYSKVEWTPWAADTVDSAKCFMLTSHMSVVSGGFRFPTDYTVAYWINWKKSSSVWRTLLRMDSGDHQVIVDNNGGLKLGNYYQGFRATSPNYNIQMGWGLLLTIGSGGSQRFMECRSNDANCRYRGVTDRSVAGTDLALLGYYDQQPGCVGQMLVYDRVLSHLEILQLWDATRRNFGLDLVHVGCFKDSLAAPVLTLLEGNADVADLLVGTPTTREDPIDACGRAARRIRHRIFGIQRGGFCYSAAAETASYDKNGSSQDCSLDGRGGAVAIDIYRFMDQYAGGGCSSFECLFPPTYSILTGMITDFKDTFGQINSDRQVLASGFRDPYIFVGPLTVNGKPGAVVRTSKLGDKFVLRIREAPCYQSGTHTDDETVDYLVIDNFSDPLLLDSGGKLVVFSATVTPGAAVSVAIPGSLTAAPVCIANIQTENNPGYLTLRLKDITATTLNVILEADETGAIARGTSGKTFASQEVVAFLCVTAPTVGTSGIGSYTTKIKAVNNFPITVGKMKLPEGSLSQDFKFPSNGMGKFAGTFQTASGLPIHLRKRFLATDGKFVYRSQGDECATGSATSHVAEDVGIIAFD